MAADARFTLTTILLINAVPPEKYGKDIAMVRIFIAIGTMLPIVGRQRH